MIEPKRSENAKSPLLILSLAGRLRYFLNRSSVIYGFRSWLW